MYKSYLIILFLFVAFEAYSVRPIVIKEGKNEYEVSYNHIDIFEDTSSNLTLKEIRKFRYQKQFVTNHVMLPRNRNPNAAYWLRFQIKNPGGKHNRKWLMEFFDSSIEEIDFFIPDGEGDFEKHRAGNDYSFYRKPLNHKNFQFFLPDVPRTGYTFYARIKSSNPVFMYGVIRSYKYFTGYALNEYYGLGVFYGILLAMALYNLFMFLSIREKAYVYYIVYILSTGLYCLALDGTGFQYLWPEVPSLNDNIFVLSRFLMVFWALLYTRRFLILKSYARYFYHLINAVLYLRVLFFILAFTFWPALKSVVLIDAVPLLVAFLAGVTALMQGFTPARYFVGGFLMLFIGFIISNLTLESILGFSVPNNVYTVYSLNMGTVAEMMLFSFALSERVKLIRKEREKNREEYIQQLQENQRLKDEANKELEQKVEDRTKELEKEKQHVEHLYNEMQHNISTARLIQFALLPSHDTFRKCFPESFVLYRPKDKVSGDFYWMDKKNGKKYIAAADCTGHGVAGAFMSFIGYDHLNTINKYNDTISPGEILRQLNEGVIEALNQRDVDSRSREGMDISLAVIDEHNGTLQFSGARNSLYLLRNGEIKQIKATRKSLGMEKHTAGKDFETYEEALKDGDILYLFTDGYADQVGRNGERLKKIKYPQFRALLLNNADKEMGEQQQALENYLDNWQGTLEQTDDILVIGIKVRLSST